MKYILSLITYLFLTVTLFSQNKLNNQFKITIEDRPGVSEDSSGKRYIHALILTGSDGCDSVFMAEGILVNAKFGNILSVQLLPEKLDLLNKIPCVTFIEISTRANAARIKNDIERASTSVDKVQQGLNNGLPANYSGKGVIVGIVDIGFQCNHPTFYTSDGKYRVLRYWQQNNKSGVRPAGFNYGSEFKDTALIQLVNDMDGSHGTHVAGIAAGSGLTTPGLQYRGMAPEADLVFVGIKYSNDTLGGSALGDYLVANPCILDAYAYIFNYAASVGKPAVINLSWGMHTGPHDGNSLFDKACENLTGPGKIVIGANGNEGDNPMHFLHRFNNDTASSIMIENGRQWRQRESVYSDFWGSAGSSFSLKIQFIDTNKNLICETPFLSSASNQNKSFNFFADSSNFKVDIACLSSYPGNNKPNITVMAGHQNQRKYAIVVKISSDTSLVHGWNSGAGREWTSGSFTDKLNRIDFSGSFVNGNTDYTAGENGGTSKAVISVGAFAARSAYLNVKGVNVNDSSYVIPGSITRFSSKGPTVDGRVKPDISAPGYDVPSSVNNKQFAPWMLDKTLLKTVFRNDTQYWTAFNGTSMAAPHVSGIVALLLQINPLFTPAQIRDILKTGAVTDQFTSAVPNMQYGYGKVNAFASVVYALQISGINTMNRGDWPMLYPNPFESELNLQFNKPQSDTYLSLTGIDGRCVYETILDEGQTGIRIETANLSPGIYFLRMRSGGEIFVWKLIKS